LCFFSSDLALLVEKSEDGACKTEIEELKKNLGNQEKQLFVRLLKILGS